MPPPILLRRATSVLESKMPSSESSTVSMKQLEKARPATFLPALDIVGVAAVMYMLLMAQYASLTRSIRPRQALGALGTWR